MPLVSGDKVSFAQAIAYFRQKLNLPTQSYRDLERAEHDWAFTVAGATSAQLLADLRGAVDKALATGTSIQDFRRDFDALVDRHGWTYNGGKAWRTETILMTNIRSAHAAGRYQQMTDPDTLKSRPYWQWRHRDSRSPRPLHQAWDGLVLPADDPWWETHYPPCGYGCRCVVFALSDRDLERLGKSGPDQAPDDGSYSFTNPATGETRQIPNGVDPGWDYTPGKAKAQDRERILDAIKGRLPEDLRQQVPAVPSPKKAARLEASAVIEAENSIRLNNFETLISFGPDGSILLNKPGQQYEVALTDAEFKTIQFSVVTHNHPRGLEYSDSDPRSFGNSFSGEDIELACYAQLEEIRAVTPKLRFSMKPGPSGWSEDYYEKTLGPIINKEEAKLKKQFFKAIRAGTMTVPEAQSQHNHELWTRVAAKTGLVYTREED